MALALSVAIPSGARAQVQLPATFSDQLVMSQLYFPTTMAFLPDRRLVVAERQGTLRLIVEGKLGAVDPFGVVDSVAIASSRQGLLGVAIDPGWPARPYVYVGYDAADQTVRVSRYTAVGDLTHGTSVDLALDPGSRHDVLRGMPNPGLANGIGALRFGPDGKLYVSLSDADEACTVQDSAAWRGVVLRLDPDGVPAGGGPPPSRASLVPGDNPRAGHPNANIALLWSMGFKNPFRFHLDPYSGALYVGDQGDQFYQEIDRIQGGGTNNGWPLFEGPELRDPPCPVNDTEVYATPIHSYLDRAPSGEALVVDGGIYHPNACSNCSFPPEYAGDYFFSDYFAGFLRRLHFDGTSWSLAAPVSGQPSSSDWGRGFAGVSDFVTAPDGALWYVQNGDGGPNGEVHRIFHVPPTGAVPAPRPASASFAPPYPSPARDRVRFAYTLFAAARVDLELFDIGGRLVERVVSAARQEAGEHRATWSGRMAGGRATPGVYLARLRVDGVTFERRVLLIP